MKYKKISTNRELPALLGELVVYFDEGLTAPPPAEECALNCDVDADRPRHLPSGCIRGGADNPPSHGARRGRSVQEG